MTLTSFFAKARGFIIEGGNFTNVGGDQVINNNQQIFYGEQKRELTEYDQFRQVIKGDIYWTNDLGVYQYSKRWDLGDREWLERGLPRADRTICTAQVIGGEGRTFTVVSYTGPEAQQALEKDFRMFSRSLTADSFQIYGVNTHFPTVLFHHELQPAAYFRDNLSYWGKFYLESIQIRFGCDNNEVWLDSRKGLLCQGPTGPDWEKPADFFDMKVLLLPQSAGLLDGDMCLQFLASRKSKDVDETVVNAICLCRHYGVFIREVYQPTILSNRTNATIAVGGGVWRRNWDDNCLGEREVMGNGETRFALKGAGRLYIRTDGYEEQHFWIVQALSVFQALGVSLDDDLKHYQLVAPDLELKGHLSESKCLHQKHCEKPIYLFIRPLSSSTPSTSCTTPTLHYWSFDPTGGRPLAAEACNQLGIPTELSLTVNSVSWHRSFRVCWDNEWYRIMHDYQLARGFNSMTTDFARHLGYPIYSVQNDADCFADLPPDTQASDKTSSQKSSWSRWSWAVSEDSDIPAVGL